MIKRRIELENDPVWARKHEVLKDEKARALARKKYIRVSRNCMRCGKKDLPYTRKLCDKCFIQAQIEAYSDM